MPYAIRLVKCDVCRVELLDRYPPEGPYLCPSHAIELSVAWTLYLHDQGPRWRLQWIAEAAERERPGAELVRRAMGPGE